tara:strand:- start:62 stop:604 length:543 start_codon:yes stop_codon:yes gene_type:complete
MDYPNNSEAMPVVVNSFSRYFTSAASINAYAVGTALTSTSPGSSTSPLMPFTLPSSYLVASLFICNGATVNGNTDVAIYAAGGSGTSTRITSVGTTAMSGSLVPQIRALATPILLPPGNYYLGVYNSGSGTYSGVTFTAFQSALCGIMETGSALNTSVAVTRSTGFHYYLAGFSRLASGY